MRVYSRERGVSLPPLIDVHHHVVPPGVKHRLADLGVTDVGGVPIPDWNEARELEVLDRHGIAAAVVSLSDTGPVGERIGLAGLLAREANEFYADLIRLHERRLGAFAVLPLPHVDAALAELAYALDVLRLDGVLLLSNYAGRYLGDPSFDAVLAELDRRSAVVFLHPGTPPSSPTPEVPTFLLDYVFETTRAVTSLLRHGALQRFSSIRLVLAHAGGTVPYLLERLALGQVPVGARDITGRLAAIPIARAAVEAVTDAVVERSERQVTAALGALWYDTALSTAPPTLLALDSLAGPGRVVFGSDYPYAPELFIERTARRVAAYWNDVELDQVARRNAAGLFPRLSVG